MSESDPANCIGCLDKEDFSKSYTLPRERAAGGKTKDQRKTKIRIGAFPTTPLLCLFQDVRGCHKPLKSRRQASQPD